MAACVAKVQYEALAGLHLEAKVPASPAQNRPGLTCPLAMETVADLPAFLGKPLEASRALDDTFD